MSRDAWAERIAEMERKKVARIGQARAWNGNVEPVSFASAQAEPAKPQRASGSHVDDKSAIRQMVYPLVTLCRQMRIAEPVPEYRFHATRKWRFDYAWPLHMLAMEIDGGVWTQGRHTRGAGAIADMEKLSEAAILGWRVLYAVPDDLKNGQALDRVIRALTDREAA